MAQDTYDIEMDMAEQDEAEATSHLYTPLDVLNQTAGYERTKKRDNVAELSASHDADILATEGEVDRVYAVNKDASTSYTADRIHFTREGFEEAERQLFNELGTVEEPSQAYKMLEYNKGQLDRVLATPYAHEASIELVSKGRIENAPSEFTAGQMQGLSEESGLFDVIGDWAGVFLWPDHPKDQADFAELISGEYVFLPNGKEEMTKLLHSFNMLPQETRDILMPELASLALEAADGNTVKAKQLMAPFLMASSIEAENEVSFNTALGYIDWALVGAWPAVQLYKVGRTVTTVGRMARLQSKEAAAQAANKAISDPTGQIADVVGQTKSSLFATGHPVNQSRVIFDSTDDLSGEMSKVASQLENERAVLRDTLEEAVEADYLHVRLLDEDEMVAFSQSTKTNLHSWAEGYYRGRGYDIQGAEIINSTKDGFQVRIHMLGPDGMADKSITTDVLSYTLDGIRKPTKKVTANPITTYLASPKVWLDAAFKEGLLPESTVIGFQQMHLQSIFTKAMREAFKGVNKESRKKVDAVLWAGSESVPTKAGRNTTKGKYYSWSELEKGVDVNGELVQLNNAEKIAYYKARDIFDSNWVMLNRMQRELLKSENYMEAAISGVPSILRPWRLREEVPGSVYAGGTNKVATSYNPITGGAFNLTKKSIDEMYEKGWILADLHKSSRVAGELNGKKTQFSKVWVRPTELKELRANPIHYVEGYVPRIYKGSPYVVTKTIQEGVDGGTEASTSIVRLFEKKADAAKYAEEQTAKSKRGSVYSHRHQDEADMRTKRELILQEAGGLFIDPKGQHLKLGLGEGKLAPIFDPTEALARQLGYLAKTMPANLWRQSVIQRWEEAAALAAGSNKALLAEVREKGFWVNLDQFGDKRARAALDASRIWIRDQLMMMTPQESAWQGQVWRLAEWIEDVDKLSYAHKGLMWAGSKDPFSALRGASFYGMLGFWNPAQLIVQAQGFAVAAALDGLNPAKVLGRSRQYLALRALGDWKHVNPEVLKGAARAGGYKPDELLAIHNDFRKSGLLDSVRTNADLEMMKNGFPVDKGAIRRAFDTNLFFYREGEMFTRGYSFLVARERYLAKHGLPTNTKLNEDQLLAVVESTTDKMLNLNRANRAQWQKGIFSIPTQFFQVTTKFVEDFFPKIPGTSIGGVSKFDTAAKNKVLASQLILYGGAGMPFGTLMIEKLMEAAGVKPGDWDENVIAGLRDGIGGMFSELMFDESVQIGKRGAYLSGLEQMAMNMLKDQVSMSEIAAGASGHMLSRMAKVLGGLAPLVFNPDVKINGTEMELVLQDLSGVFSTFSNGHKAYLWWKWQKIVNDRNQVVLTAEQADNFHAIWLMKALGFNASTIEDVYSADNFTRDFTQSKKEVKDAMKEVAADYLYKASSGTVSPADYRNMEAKWFALVAPYEEHIRDELIREMFEEVRNEESKADKSWTKAFRLFIESGETQSGAYGIGLNSNIVKDNEDGN